MRHLGLQRVIINLLLPRGHSCVTIKMTHIQLSGSWPHLQVWWTLLWGWLNLQLFRMAACFPQQILSDVYLTDLKPRKSIINCFKRDFNSFSLPKPGNASSHQNLKACPAWAQLCLQIRINVKTGLYCLRLLLYSGLNKMCNKVHLINTGGKHRCVSVWCADKTVRVTLTPRTAQRCPWLFPWGSTAQAAAWQKHILQTGKRKQRSEIYSKRQSELFKVRRSSETELKVSLSQQCLKWFGSVHLISLGILQIKGFRALKNCLLTTDKM